MLLGAPGLTTSNKKLLVHQTSAREVHLRPSFTPWRHWTTDRHDGDRTTRTWHLDVRSWWASLVRIEERKITDDH